MAKILISGNFSKIIEETDLEFLKKLDNYLSFTIPGAQYSRAFKGFVGKDGKFQRWDGTQRILTGRLEFPSGLVERVKEFFAAEGKEIEVIDQRPPKSLGKPIDISERLKKIGKEPYDHQLKAIEAILNNDRGIIKSCTGSGKCSSYDSLHVTEHGLLNYHELLADVKLEQGEFVNYSAAVATPLTDSKLDNASAIYCDGYSESIEITTAYGFTITGTPDHKIKVINDDGDLVWKKLYDIRENDWAVISPGTQLFGKDQLDLDTAYWYGLLLGDGGLSRTNTVTFTNMDEHLLNFAQTYLASKKIKFSVKKSKSKAKEIHIYSKPYRTSLYEFGFEYKKSIHKSLPVSIRKLAKEPLTMVIRGLYETNGWVDKVSERPSICIALPNKEFINQLHLLLLNYGIVASRRVKKTTHGDSHILSIYRDFIPAFQRQIGFDPNGRKFEELNEVLSKFNSQTNTSKTCITEEENKLINEMSYLCEEDVFFLPIKSIKKVTSLNYDFVVPETHSFVSQGFINHNTLIGAMAVSSIGKKANIYVIGKDLLEQFYQLLKEVFGKGNVGIVGDGHCIIKDINVISVWTAGKALGLSANEILSEKEDTGEEDIDASKYQDVLNALKEAKVHILDECHIGSCSTIQTLYKHITPEHIYGMSGSPWRDDNSGLLIEGILGRNIVDIPASFLIERGFLAKPIIKFLPVPPLAETSKNYQKVYRDYVVNNPVRNGMVVNATKSLVSKGYQTLVLFNSIAHGKILYEMIKNSGIPCAMLDGSDTQEVRNEIKKKALAGKIKCIIASRIFDIGVDIPSLSGLVLASAGKSTVRCLQRIGRVIRKYPGKTHAAIVDFADDAIYLDKHAKIRYKTYKSESGFEVHWSKKKKGHSSKA